MWLLTFFPSIFIHLIFLAGVLLIAASFFLGVVPFFNTYKTLIRLAGFILLGSGLYYEGGLAHKEAQALAVAKLEFKLKDAEAKSAKKNVEIVEKIVNDTQVIHEKGKTITQYVDREVVKYNDRCVIPSEVIKAHNMAATLNTEAESKTEGDKK